MRKHQQAAQIWPVLCLAASQGQTLESSTLKTLFSITDTELNDAVLYINAYCVHHTLPMLTQLLNGELAELTPLFEFSWIDFGTPLAEDFLFAAKVQPHAA